MSYRKRKPSEGGKKKGGSCGDNGQGFGQESPRNKLAHQCALVPTLRNASVSPSNRELISQSLSTLARKENINTCRHSRRLPERGDEGREEGEEKDAS